MPDQAALTSSPTPTQGRVAAAVARVPPTSYFATSAVFHYLGPSLAVLLFVHVDVLGVAWLRIASAAVVLGVWRRPWRTLSRATPEERWLMAVLGVVLAAMNVLFYLAVDRLPLSTVGAIEFLGTVVIAALGVRTFRNLAALAVAVAGVFVLTDVRLGGEPWGFVFAFANCVGFMVYVVLGHRVANADPDPSDATLSMRGIDTLAAAMLVAAVVATPWGHDRRVASLQPSDLAGLGDRRRAVFVRHPLRHRPARHGQDAAIDVRPQLALLPAMATAIGLLVLDQVPTWRDLAGVGLVVLGVAVHQQRST